MTTQNSKSTLQNSDYGVLALSIGLVLPLQVLQSNAGYYIGTYDDEGPVSRESHEYFSSNEKAQKALETGAWSQRLYP